MAYKYPGTARGMQLLIENPILIPIFIGIVLIIRFVYLNSDNILNKLKEAICNFRTKSKK